MTLPRFYCPEIIDNLKNNINPVINNINNIFTLPNTLCHHIKVLRLNVNDKIQLFDGNGYYVNALIHYINSGTVNVSVLCDNNNENNTISYINNNALTELPFKLLIAQSLIESSKMDWVIEKAVEMGVAELYPIAASRSVIRLDANRAQKRLNHWDGISIAASEQCGRNHLLKNSLPLSVKQALNVLQLFSQSEKTSVRHLLLHPEGGMPLQTFCKTHTPQTVMLWIGPEGGWSKEELTILENAGAIRITFGTRVLRTESAGVAISAAIQALWT